MDPARFQHDFVSLGGVRLHCVSAGSGPLVVLLHGFPEFWYSWRHQMHALADVGFRAVAPDLRGYHTSDRPLGVRNYAIDLLVTDVAELIVALGSARAIVIGHDWGGFIAWHLALQRPELVERLVILNAPHPAAIRREMRNPRQWLRSWYVFVFQLPGLPEWLLAAGDGALQRRVFGRTPSRPNAFTPEDLQKYREAFPTRRDWTAPVNYYRAAFRYRPSRRLVPILTPTLLVWAERDPYLGPRLSHGLEPWVPNLRVERLPDVGHWLQNEAPERVNELILRFLR
jgi:pimeloyl-ACP methyl ester carboxylesterase